MKKLFEDDHEEKVEIKTNNEYAKNYDIWRRKEEANKLKTKYGDDYSLSDSESSSSEDEVGVELNENVEKQFFKTLSCLKGKDPRIYDEKTKFFDDNIELQKDKKKKSKNQSMYLKDYERNLILERGGKFSDSDDEESSRPKSPTYVEVIRKTKDDFKKAITNIDEDEEWDGLCKPRQKTKEEIEQEEADYKKLLAGQKETIDDEDTARDLNPLKEFWNDPNLDEGEKFLRDYILNKRFLDDEDEDHVPTYDEIVHDSDEGFSEDENNVQKQEEFEHKYNYRFEEPDQEFIKRYPRTMENSLRRKDDRRKIKRAKLKERKLKEKQQKKEELKKLQELKRKEIEEKIQQLKEITGNTDVAFNDDDIDGDFDPEAHDKRMQALFNEEFYQGPEEEQKPEFPELDEELEIENWDKWHGEDKIEEGQVEDAPHCEDDDFNMDADYDPHSTQKELVENTKNRRKRKRKSKFAKIISEPRPVFDPNDKTYEEYLDEYYKFDCEDVIGDIPCRFKYRKVVPNSFGLAIEEILMAKDRELNRWCSLKKAVQYRPESVEKYDQIAYERKAKNELLKKKILPSLFEEEETGTHNNSVASKKDHVEKQENNEECKTKANDVLKSKNKKKKRNKKQEIENTTEMQDTSAEQQHKTKKPKAQRAKGDEVAVDLQDQNGTQQIQKSKSKKRKHSEEPAQEAPAKKTQKHNKKKHKNERNDTELKISDARLKAFGFNAKKFKNKLKYGKKQS